MDNFYENKEITKKKKNQLNISEDSRGKIWFFSVFLKAKNVDMLYMFLTNLLGGGGWFFT